MVDEVGKPYKQAIGDTSYKRVVGFRNSVSDKEFREGGFDVERYTQKAACKDPS